MIAPMADFWRHVRADLYRANMGRCSLMAGLRAYRLIPGFRYMFWFRASTATRGGGIYLWPVHVICRLMHNRYRFKYGISIPYDARLGRGFYIGHFGGIVVSSQAVIGDNCNISQSVTIGQTNRGVRQGAPHLGNNIYIGPGAKIIGGITIGDGCAIGANAVVTRDLPENAVAVGIPAQVISLEGSHGYVEYIDYPW